MEAVRSKNTKLLFCTTGVIMRRLLDDSDLKAVTHIIVDEVHERQVQTDVLLIALRQLLTTTRKDLKVILVRSLIYTCARSSEDLLIVLLVAVVADVCDSGCNLVFQFFLQCTGDQSTRPDISRI